MHSSFQIIIYKVSPVMQNNTLGEQPQIWNSENVLVKYLKPWKCVVETL